MISKTVIPKSSRSFGLTQWRIEIREFLYTHLVMTNSLIEVEIKRDSRSCNRITENLKATYKDMKDKVDHGSNKAYTSWEKTYNILVTTFGELF